jgi:hypothetical protein
MKINFYLKFTLFISVQISVLLNFSTNLEYVPSVLNHVRSALESDQTARLV